MAGEGQEATAFLQIVVGNIFIPLARDCLMMAGKAFGWGCKNFGKGVIKPVSRNIANHLAGHGDRGWVRRLAPGEKVTVYPMDGMVERSDLKQLNDACRELGVRFKVGKMPDGNYTLVFGAKDEEMMRFAMGKVFHGFNLDEKEIAEASEEAPKELTEAAGNEPLVGQLLGDETVAAGADDAAAKGDGRLVAYKDEETYLRGGVTWTKDPVEKDGLVRFHGTLLEPREDGTGGMMAHVAEDGSMLVTTMTKSGTRVPVELPMSDGSKVVLSSMSLPSDTPGLAGGIDSALRAYRWAKDAYAQDRNLSKAVGPEIEVGVGATNPNRSKSRMRTPGSAAVIRMARYAVSRGASLKQTGRRRGAQPVNRQQHVMRRDA